MENNVTKQSRFDRISKVLTLGANIGVVLGLALLIMEIRQNAALTRSTLESQKNSFLAQIETSMTSPENLEAWVKSIRHPETMTDKDIKIMDAYLLSVMLQWDQVLHMVKNGLLSREDAKYHIKNCAPFTFGSRFAKKWYALQELGWENSIMRELADPIISNLSDSFLEDYLDQLAKISDREPVAGGDRAG